MGAQLTSSDSGFQENMNNHSLAFADLDDTLFATRRKQSNLDLCKVASLTPAGDPSGWQNPRQRQLLDWLSTFGDVVPVTARTREALARVQLPFSLHHVANHGAFIQIDGQEDLAWTQRSLEALGPIRAQWRRFGQALKALPGLADARCKEGCDHAYGETTFDVMLRGIVEHGGAVRDLVEEMWGDAAWLHIQKDYISVVPRGVSKQRAVAHLIEVLKPEHTVGVGDSLSDVPFMGLCDLVLMPSTSQAFEHVEQSLVEHAFP